MSALSALSALLLSATITVAGTVDPGHRAAETTYGPDQFLDVVLAADRPGLAPIGPVPPITGDPGLDARIRAIGEQRGYIRRPLPSRPLLPVSGDGGQTEYLQPEAAAAWQTLRDAAATAGHRIVLRSGYRDHATQAAVFRSGLEGTSDTAIDERLRLSAVPGYSKHHTGYALDILTPGGDFADFRGSGAYRWLAADNFANAKAHGFVPSYPDGSRPAGPQPEAWEFIWIGTAAIVCGDFSPTDTLPFCDIEGTTFEADIAWLADAGLTTGCTPVRFCRADPVTRGEAATFLWRLAGRPPAPSGDRSDGPFDDVAPDAFFHDAVAWLAARDITEGTSPTTFSPDRPVRRDEFVTFLWRAAGRPDAPGATTGRFDDVDPSGFAAEAVAWAAAAGITEGTSPTTFSPDLTNTRGQTAAFLHRHADATG